MAHELDFRANGTASVFSVGETPWHQLGTVLGDAPSFDEAMEVGGLDYPVEVRPVYVPQRYTTYAYAAGGVRQIEATRYVESTTTRIVVRPDRDLELARVGMQYTAVQNRDAFSVLTPLIDEGLLTLETGGAIREGRRAWLLGRFDLSRFGDDARDVFGGEGVIPYATIDNDHTGARSITAQLTPIRKVCANTLGMADARADQGLDRVIRVQHTADAQLRLVEAAQELFRGIVERCEVVARQYRLLRSYQLDEQMFKTLVLDAVAPDPRADRKWNPDAKLAEAVVARHERKVELITALWTGGKGHTGDHSAWEAYNGTVEALDHDAAGLYPTRAGVRRSASLLTGSLAAMKQAVLDNVVNAATAAAAIAG